MPPRAKKCRMEMEPSVRILQFTPPCKGVAITRSQIFPKLTLVAVTFSLTTSTRKMAS